MIFIFSLLGYAVSLKIGRVSRTEIVPGFLEPGDTVAGLTESGSVPGDRTKPRPLMEE